MAKKKKNKGDYNYAAAIKAGLIPNPGEHWQSVDPTTGYFLKSKQHETLGKELDWFRSQGMVGVFSPATQKIVTDPTGYFGEDQLRYIPIGDFIGPSEYSHGGPHNTDLDKVKKGLRYVESSDGLKMINPYSSATGLYGQLYNAEELQNMSYLQGVDRQSFASDTTLQNRLFEDRYFGKIPGVPGLGKNANDLRVEYKKVLENKGIPFNYTDDEISALSNLLGRQGTREYFGYVLRDGRSLADVFPKIYGADAEAPNKTPEKYLETYREGRDLKYGGNMKKINKYNNGGDPPVKQPDYLQYKGPNYFMEGNPAFDLETYQKAITRDSTALSDAFFPKYMFDEMKRLQLNRQLRNKIQPYTEAEIRDLNLVGEQYTGPAVDMDMFMQQYMDRGVDDRAYGGKSTNPPFMSAMSPSFTGPAEEPTERINELKRNIENYRKKYDEFMQYHTLRRLENPNYPAMAKENFKFYEDAIKDQKELKRLTSKNKKYGGKSMDVDYEAEGGEVVIGDISINRMYNGGTAKQYKGASMYMLGGPSHADGGIGIKMNSKEPSYVFTDRLKVGGMKGATYADMAAKFGNELDDINTMAMGGDKYDRATAKLMNPRIMEDVKDLFDDQEAFKKENNIDQEPDKAALGLAALATGAGLSKGLAAAQFLPGLINIGRGLVGGQAELEYDPIVAETQEYQDFNPLIKTYLGQQDRSLATLRAGLEGSGVSGVGLRANLQAGLNQSQNNAANFLSQVGQMQEQSDRQTDQFNIGQRAAAQQDNLQAEMMNDQFMAQNNPMQSFSQGLSQILGTATSMSREGYQRGIMNQLFGLGNNTTATANNTSSPYNTDEIENFLMALKGQYGIK